jgi:hypothetical protein
MINNGKQLVYVRVHWRPVYASNDVVEALRSPYGKILDVTFGNLDVGKHHFKSVARLVKLEVNEIEKQKIPHLIKFQCGGESSAHHTGQAATLVKMSSKLATTGTLAVVKLR